jgi:hypothetical protein
LAAREMGPERETPVASSVAQARRIMRDFVKVVS